MKQCIRIIPEVDEWFNLVLSEKIVVYRHFLIFNMASKISRKSSHEFFSLMVQIMLFYILATFRESFTAIG